MRTLILEALTLQKTWEEIKVSVHLKYQTQTFTYPLATLWTFITQKRNRWQHMFIDLNERLTDVHLKMMLPLSEFL